MKKIIFAFVLSLFTISFASSQNVFVPNSGDSQLDNDLIALNKRAKANMTEFKDDIKTRFGLAHDRVQKIMDQFKMEPADVLMTAKVAQLTKKEPEVVCESFQKNREKGWGAIAKEMGIKPGSSEFHELKNASKGRGNGKENSKGKDKPKDSKSNGGADKGNKGGKGKGGPKDKGKSK